MTVDGKGRVVLVGETRVESANGQFRPAIVRLKSSGDLDPSFSGDGKIVWKAVGDAAAVAIQHVGTDRIVVGGDGPFVEARYRS